MFNVIIPGDVTRVLGSLLDREAVIAVLTALRDSLETNGQQLRKRRHPEDPDTYFTYPLRVYDGNRWHRLWFTVDDVQAESYFFVVAVDPQ